MQLVEQHIIEHGDPRYERIDRASFASKNLWNAANYLVRQSFIFQGTYLDNVKVFHHIKSHESYQDLPRKVSNQVLIQLHAAWEGFFEAMDEWREHPEKFLGRPNLPGYKHKEQGRNLLVYEKEAISKRALKMGMISLSGLGDLVPTKQSRATIDQVCIVPRSTHFIIEVVYSKAEAKADLDPALFASLDLGVTNLAALTSNQCGFVPLLVNGRPLKAWNQEYNKRRAALQAKIAKTNRFTSRASFFDRDEIPAYDPEPTEPLTFSGRRISRGMYRAKDGRLIHADVNGSLNIARKVFPTAFDGLGIGVSAVRPRRLAV